MSRTSRCLLFALLLGIGLGSGPATAEDEERPEPGVPDAELQEAINKAIDTGAAWLRREQSPSGALGGVVARGSLHHEIGTTALAGLALLAAGNKRGDDCVDKVYGYCKTKDELYSDAGGRRTYDTGILLMFLTKYWRKEEPKEEPKAGTRPGRSSKNPCDLPPEVMRWVQDLASWLVRVRKPTTSTWGYPQHRDDNSNTQYAFLGLRAARDCGAKIPPAVFLQSAKTYVDRQEKDGPKVPRILRSPDPRMKDYVIGMDRARGWSYLQEPFLATGSMTTSGIAILAICNDALTHPARAKTYAGELERKVITSIHDGFAWLDKNWAVDKNPGLGAAWHFYYLYGLERAAAFGRRDLIGLHDWYIDGARYLVGEQQGDGRWSTGNMGIDDTFEASDVVDTAWAILFLARATRPMPPLPVVTPGD
jgi:hypothetical protein